MLILTRKEGESIAIGEPSLIEIRILGLRGSQVRLGIIAPKYIPVHREEVYQRIQIEKAQPLIKKRLFSVASNYPHTFFELAMLLPRDDQIELAKELLKKSATFGHSKAARYLERLEVRKKYKTGVILAKIYDQDESLERGEND